MRAEVGDDFDQRRFAQAGLHDDLKRAVARQLFDPALAKWDRRSATFTVLSFKC